MGQYIPELKRALRFVQSALHEEAAEILRGLLLQVREPPRWKSPAHPPSDMGAWHWIWLAHAVISGETGSPDLVPPETALKTALDLLECGSPTQEPDAD